jgi:hypothetical protein
MSGETLLNDCAAPGSTMLSFKPSPMFSKAISGDILL